MGTRSRQNGRRERQDRAIKAFEAQIVKHEANTEYITKILADKEIKATEEEIEKLRKKKVERATATIENTKKNLRV
jgi:hypothetical protein|tara:strand:- start:33 stop:260 length:228 start_codon:yes stop_codon:yes gene_type:complete